VGLVSSYETTDGQTHAAADVWFVADKAASLDFGDGSLGAQNVAAPPVAPAAPEPASGLRGQVMGLAQAINSFSNEAQGSTSASGGLLGEAASGRASSLALVSMVDVMKQFDANGNLVNKTPSLATTLPNPTTLPKELTDASMLAVPGPKLSG
jgi:hypothetical protein